MTPIQMVSGGVLTFKEACEYLRVKKTFFEGVLSRGEIPYTYVGRHRRIPKIALDEYLAKNLRGGGYVAEAGARKPRMRRRVIRKQVM